MTQQTIDLNSRIPYYVQLMDTLRGEVEQGVWKPGERLPGEYELCEIYGVSRTVVRQALRELEFEGFIVRRKGKGSYVAEPKVSESLAQRLLGFHQDMTERGYTPQSQVLKLEIVSAGQKVAEYLEINPGATIVEMERLRSVDDEPRVLVTSFLPYAFFPGLERFDFASRSLYATIEVEYGQKIVRGRRFIEALIADRREARLLRVDVGSPLLSVHSIAYGENGEPIEYYHAVHRGDRSRFEVELVRIQERGQVRQTLAPGELNLPTGAVVHHSN